MFTLEAIDIIKMSGCYDYHAVWVYTNLKSVSHQSSK